MIVDAHKLAREHAASVTRQAVSDHWFHVAGGIVALGMRCTLVIIDGQVSE